MAHMTVISKDMELKDILHALKIGMIIKEYKETPDGLEIEWEAKLFQEQQIQLPQELKTKICEMYKGGVSVPGISKETGIQTPSIYNILIKAGLYTKKEKADVLKRNMEIMNYRREGKTFAELAYRYGLSVNGICAIVHKGEEGMLVKPGTAEEFDLLKNMLKDYIDELRTMEPSIEDRTADKLAGEYFNTEDTDFYLLQHGYRTVGFAIVGHDSNCHSEVDLYLEEFYIIREYRGQGLTRKFIKKITETANSVCFFVAKANTFADYVWKQIFSEWTDRSKQIHDTSAAPDWLEWYVYKKKTAKKTDRQEQPKE